MPEGVRIYAIGDIHGRLDLLDDLLTRVEHDHIRQPAEKPILVFLGDYIDRGPDSCGVIERLIECSQFGQVQCLKGNHEAFLLKFFQDPSLLSDWGRYGGLDTLLSYGLRPPLNGWADAGGELVSELRQAVPERHRDFLQRLPLSFSCGDYFFVHAGVRPGLALEQQNESDLLWIRQDFLMHKGLHQKIVVHGHTPVLRPEIMHNRINIDTGAYATGKLTCLILEDDDIQFL